MAAPTPALTPRAKSIVAACVAVVLAGVTAWQQLGHDRFSWADVAPVAVAVLSAIVTDLIPNTGDQPVAKAIAHGALAVASAIATVVAADPSGLTAAKLLTVAVGAALVWFIPEAGPDVADVVANATNEPFVVGGHPATSLDGGHPATSLAAPTGDRSASMGPDLDLSATQPFQAVTDTTEPPAPAAPAVPRIPVA